MEVVRLPSWIYLHYLRLSLCLLPSFPLLSLPRSQKQVSASHNLHCALPDHPFLTRSKSGDLKTTRRLVSDFLRLSVKTLEAAVCVHPVQGP